MENLLIYIATFTASLLTFFSGFGLGTLLLAILALFFPLELAIFYTAVVHLLNNGFKVIIFRHSIAIKQVVQFGGPAIIGSILGAMLLSLVMSWNVQYSFYLFGMALIINPIKVVVGLLLLIIGFNELRPAGGMRFVGRGALSVGGFVSGFFGGLAGLQGAFRSYFLVKWADDKYTFLGTSAAVALIVDIARLSIYVRFVSHITEITSAGLGIIGAALAGIFVGKQLLAAVEMESIHRLIAYFLVCFGLLLTSGII